MENEPKPKPHIVISHNHDTGFICNYTNEDPDGTASGGSVPLSEFSLDGEKYAKYSYIAVHLKWLQKDILTILEASIDDDRQLNAMKQIVKDKFSSKLDWIYQQLQASEKEQTHLASEIL